MPERSTDILRAMRIIAGKWRGQRITAPDTMDTRPILDRAKTVLFDMLGTRLAEPGRLPPIAVLDLFAGSGALGLEALSRGARYCLFVEQNRSIARIIRKNLDTLEVVGEGSVLQADVGRCRIPPPPAAEDSPGAPREYELVFLDPPYRLLAGPRPDQSLFGIIDWLARDPLVSPEAAIVVRHERQPLGGPDLAPLVERERRDVGHMTLRFMERPSVAGDAHSSDAGTSEGSS